MDLSATAVVTGAGGVIGRALCVALARRNASVLAVDLDDESLRATVAAVADIGGTCVGHQADVTDEKSVQRFVDAAVTNFGSLDWLSNNAGIEGPAAEISAYPTDSFQRVIEINVMSVFLGMKAALPVMRRNGGGRIVNTASVAGLYATPQLIAYGASKHAVIGMTRTAAVEAAADGISVNAICPGPQESRMMDSIEAAIVTNDPRGARAAYTSTIPLGRYGYPDEIADTVAWLFAEAPAYLTGQTIVVDGGLLIS